MIHSALAAKLPALPEWSEEDKQRLEAGELIVGGALLADEFVIPEREQNVTPSVEVVIEAVEEKPQEPGFEVLDQNSTIFGRHLLNYFGEQASSHLVDPQQLLSMQERQDFLYALKVHADVAKVPVYVYLFDEEQRVPEGYHPEQNFKRVFKSVEKPILIVYYYMGAPMRSQLALVGGQSSEVPDWHMRELLWNSSDKAKEKSDVFDQLDAFLGQVSMRLFWVEELLDELVVENRSPLEVAEEANTSEVGSSKLYQNLIAKVNLSVEQLMLSLSVFILILTSFLWWWKRRYIFPDTPSPRRLGAKNGGTCGGVLAFRDAHESPSEQGKRFDKDFF
ncbi:hypothetical protein [Rubritalea marina]|uniref:hypothetical protein n=1 Tax=Rubritalea marina TaxID=361055 RepID=UPI00037F5C77|nr:hypothetical protein [Rubritalea marina]